VVRAAVGRARPRRPLLTKTWPDHGKSPIDSADVDTVPTRVVSRKGTAWRRGCDSPTSSASRQISS
jgi:hypothetical protein